MAVEAIARPAPEAGAHPETMVARRIGRQSLRAAWAWGLAFGSYILVSAVGYAGLYKTQAARLQFARGIGSNTGLAAMIGPARHLETVAGFTAWRCLGVLGIVGGIWGLMAGTKLLRGEEDQGRWELLLAGQTTRRRAAAHGLAGMAAGWAGLFAITAACTLMGGAAVKPAFSPSASLFMALASTTTAAVFLGVGALAGQLAATRRQAAMLSGVVLGACYLLRAAGDTSTGLRWLLWTTPLGWAGNLKPLTGSQPLWLLPIAALVLALGTLTVVLAGRRDLGASVLSARDTAPARTALLGRASLLTVRLGRPTGLAWVAGAAVSGLVWGSIARSAVSAINNSIQRALNQLGATQTGITAMLGLLFLVMAVYGTVVGASLASSTREEEASGRLDNLLVRPVNRWSWLASRLAWSTLVVAACGLVGALCMWVGSSIGATQGGGPRLASVMAAGVNIIPPGLFLLGLGALVQAALPRATSGVVYGLIGWGFLVEFIGSVAKFSHWIMDTSVFFHMTLAPAASPNWVSAAGMAGLGLACALGAGFIFRHRDLATA